MRPTVTNVEWSVCLLAMSMSHAKTEKLINNKVRGLMGPKKPCLAVALGFVAFALALRIVALLTSVVQTEHILCYALLRSLTIQAQVEACTQKRLKTTDQDHTKHCTNILHTHSNKPTRSTQPCIHPGSLNRVPASAGVKAGMSPLPGGR